MLWIVDCDTEKKRSFPDRMSLGRSGSAEADNLILDIIEFEVVSDYPSGNVRQAQGS